VARVLNELVADSLHRLGRMEAGNAVESIHETRKNCKKGRALARLVRPALGDDYATINRRLRDAARVLSRFRDQQATLASFDDLAAAAPAKIPDLGAAVRAELTRRSENATAAVLDSWRHWQGEACRLLGQVRDHTGSLEVTHEFRSMKGGLERTYRRGRARMQDVAATPREDTFHEWRKPVKYLWYQVRLLRDAAPPILKPLAHSLHGLSEALGDAHDLVILIDRVSGMDQMVPRDEAEVVRGMAKRRKANLERKAIGLGRLLYVEKPSSFAARMEGYWTTWQEDPSLAGREATEYLLPTKDRNAELTGDEHHQVHATSSSGPIRRGG
jgi:CHAD domain-containing protein